ncbi:MAG: hypothetical protein KA715_11940 [Xanthomonadaceae bacterium]|nr:hypothetical protein [Xanthomonadaceae bacterium]
MKDSQLFNLRCHKSSEQSFPKLQNATQENKQIAIRFLETCFNSKTPVSVDSIQKNIHEQRPAVAMVFGSTDLFGNNPKKSIKEMKNELSSQTRFVYYPEHVNSGQIQSLGESMNGLNDFIVTKSTLKSKKGELEVAWKAKKLEYDTCLKTYDEVSKKVKSLN